MQHSTSTCCCGWSLELILQTTCTRVEPRQDLRSLRHPRCVHASARALRSSAALFPSAAAEWAKPSRSAAALRRLACETLLSIFAFCEAPGAREFSHRTSELRTLKPCVLSCFIAISGKMCTVPSAKLTVKLCIYRRGASSICTKPTPQQHLLFRSLYILEMCTGPEPHSNIKHMGTGVEPQHHFLFVFKIATKSCFSE